MWAHTAPLWESVLPVEEEGRGHVRSLLWRCVDLVVRDITSCAALDTLPLDVQAALLALVCRRRVCDRRLMRLFSPELHVGPNLLLHNMGFALSGLKVLSRFAHVASLDLSGEKAFDCRHIGPVVARMRGLTSLNLRRYPHHLSLADMKSIAGVTGLAELNLSRSRVEDAHVNLLAGLSSSLTSLNISHCRGLRGDLRALPKLTQLRELNISSANLLPLVLDYVDQVSSLVRLNAAHSMWLRDTSRLAGMTQLEDLDVGYAQLNDESLEGFLSLTRLRRLNLKGTDLSDEGITKFLSNLRNLELLDLSNTAAAKAPKKLLDQGRLASLRQVILLQNYQKFTEGHLMAIKSTTFLPRSYPELRVMCNYTSFQDTVAWTFGSPETSRDPDLCARWLEFLRGRIYNGDTKDDYYEGRWSFRPRGVESRRRLSPALRGAFNSIPEPAAKTSAQKKQLHKAKSYRESGVGSDEEDHRGHKLMVSQYSDRSSVVRRAMPYLGQLLRLMTAHFDHREVVNHGISLVRELYHYCQHKPSLRIELAQELSEQEWHDFMHRCLWAYPSDASTVKNVLKALPAIHSSAANPSLPQPRLMRALVEIMRTQATDVAIASRCVDVVCHISAAVRQTPGPARASACRYLDLALTEGFVASMVCSIAQHPHQPRLLQAAGWLVEHAIKSSLRERAIDELVHSGFLEVFRAALAPFAKTHTTREQPYVVSGHRVIKMLSAALNAAPKPVPGSWVGPSPAKRPKARKLAEILPTETKLDANRNRRRRRKQAKQSRQHFREVVRREKEKRDRKFQRTEARLKRRTYREEEAAKEEAYDRLCNVKEDRGGHWVKNQKAKSLRLKKEHRGVPRTRVRRGGPDSTQLSRRRKDLRSNSSYEWAVDIFL